MDDGTRPALTARITVLEGQQAGLVFEVARFPVILGRGDEADLRVPDDPRQPTLSRKHLRLSLGSGRLQALDLSTNGTTRGGQLLPAGQAVSLGDREELRLGPTTRLLIETLRLGQSLVLDTPSLSPEPVAEQSPPGTHRLSLRALGGFLVELDGQSVPPEAWDTRKPMVLLAYLAGLTAGRSVTIERVTEDLWPDTGGARQAMQTTLSRLRRTLRRVGQDLPDPVVLGQAGYRLNPSFQWSYDVAEFEQLSHDPASLERARQLYQGEFLPGFSEDWVVHRRAGLERTYLEAMARLGAELSGGGRSQEAVRLYQQLLDRDPLWEAGHQGLMRSFRQLGLRDEAVRHYHRYSQVLGKQLGFGPSPEMLSLYQEIVGDGA